MTVEALCKIARVPFEPYAHMSLDEARAAITLARAREDEALVIDNKRRNPGDTRSPMARAVDAVNERMNDARPSDSENP